MNWQQIEGEWKQLKGKALQHWAKLTDNEVDRIKGQREELVGRVQQHYGLAKEKAEEEVDRWARAL